MGYPRAPGGNARRAQSGASNPPRAAAAPAEPVAGRRYSPALGLAGSTAAIGAQSVDPEVTEPCDADRLRRRLLRAGLSGVTLFFFDLAGSTDFGGVPSAALATDAYALYVAWCRRLDVAPARMPLFVHELRTRHQVGSQRLRHCLAGKKSGPHGVLLFSGTTLRLDAQLARFRTIAQSIAQGQFRD